jgi:1-acyl-sn-glycerol-3-phosphate acyltransferase
VSAARALSTAWFYVVLVTTFPIGWTIGLVLFCFTAPFDPQRHLLHRFLTTFCHQYLRCWPGWHVELKGTQKLPAGPCILIANHQSMVDILAMMGLPGCFKFVSKAELFKAPLLGFMMKRLKYVPLERGKLRSAERMLEVCGALLRQGERVMIFPEGTYASGARRTPFRRGAFRLAQLEQVPIVPVVIRGTKELVFEDGPSFAPTSRVTVEVMDPSAPPPPGAPLDAWVLELEQRYAGWLGQPFANHGATEAL